MIKEYVVWEAKSETIPLEKADSFTKEDFENILVQSDNRREVARASDLDEAANFFRKGAIFDVVDENFFIKGAVVRGLYAEECRHDEDGNLCPHENDESKYRKVCKLFDYRLASSKGDVNYFDRNNGIRNGADYTSWNIFMVRNRPNASASVNSEIRFERLFVNKLLNKESLSLEDRQHIADEISRFATKYNENAARVHLFEEFLKQEMGMEWFRNIMIQFQLWI